MRSELITSLGWEKISNGHLTLLSTKDACLSAILSGKKVSIPVFRKTVASD